MTLSRTGAVKSMIRKLGGIPLCARLLEGKDEKLAREALRMIRHLASDGVFPLCHHTVLIFFVLFFSPTCFHAFFVLDDCREEINAFGLVAVITRLLSSEYIQTQKVLISLCRTCFRSIC